MKKVGDILTDPRFKEKAFNIPDGYVEGLESRVSDKINPQAAGGGFWSVAKPAALLACMFVLIFGLGYATLSLTGTLGERTSDRFAMETDAYDDGASDDELSDDIVEYLAQTLTLEDITAYTSEIGLD